MKRTKSDSFYERGKPLPAIEIAKIRYEYYENETGIKKICRMMGRSPKTVRKYVRYAEKTNQKNGPTPWKSTPYIRRVIHRILTSNPFVNGREIRRFLATECGVLMSDSTICRIRQIHNFRYKRATLVSSRRLEERVILMRLHWRKMIRGFAMERFVYVDESHFGTRDLCRRYGYAIGGKYVQNTSHRLTNKTYSLFCAVASWGVVCQRWLSVSEDGQTANAAEFISYMEMLSRHLPNEAIIVLDNARIHRTAEAFAFFKTIPQRVIFLPPYSPDYSPIELVFGETKKAMKSYYGEEKYIPAVVNESLKSLTLCQIQAFFGHCWRKNLVDEEEMLG
jgi:transposase